MRRWIARESREDRRAAVSPTVLANVYRKKDSRAFTLEDFLPHTWGGTPHHRPQRSEHQQTQSPEQQIAMLQGMSAGWGAGPDPEPATESPDGGSS